MVNLVDRENVLANQTFANFIYKWQSSYDPTHDEYMKSEGVYHDWELDTERFFTQSECDQLRKKQIKDYKNSIDGIKPTNQVQIGELIYNLIYSDVFVYTIELGNTMQRLSLYFDSPIYFYIELKTPWLYQSNTYGPVNRAIKYLRSLGVSDDYYGAIEATGIELSQLTTNLFWMIRCNAALPNIWFCDSKSKFVGDLCMHGNFHFHIFDKSIGRMIKRFAKIENLKKIEECIEEFDDNNEFGGIMGRETIFP